MRPSLDELRTCVKCGEQFRLGLDHQGKSTECGNCAEETVELLGGEVRWEGKQTPVIDITTLSKAKKFNNKTKRLGASVTRAMIPRTPNLFFSEERHTADRGAKEQHDNNPGASYTSKLGEKHNTKR